MDNEYSLTDKARELRNQYAREWRKKNPDKVRRNNQRYWDRKAAEMKDPGKSEPAEGEE